MNDLIHKMNQLVRDITSNDNAAHDLWTYLPSYDINKQTPESWDVMNEAIDELRKFKEMRRQLKDSQDSRERRKRWHEAAETHLEKAVELLEDPLRGCDPWKEEVNAWLKKEGLSLQQSISKQD